MKFSEITIRIFNIHVKSIFADKKSFVKSSLRLVKNTMLYPYITDRTENKYSGETEMLHELVHDTTRKSESHELIRVVL